MAEILRIEGLADVKSRLQGLPIHLRNKVMYAVLRKAALPIIRAAKANAPVAKKSTRRVIPGLIRNTIRTAVSKYKRPASGEFGIYIKPIVPGKIKSLKRRAGSAVYFGDPFYYKFQEFGFHAVGSKRVAGGRYARARRIFQMHAAGTANRVPGKAFLGRAYDSGKSAALAMINTEVVKAITERFNKRAK
jgi:hypothetical protein